MIVAPIEIGIIAKDLSTLQRFYIKALGVKVVSDIDVKSFPDFVLSSTPYRVARLQFPFGERLKLLSSRDTTLRKPSPAQSLTQSQGLIFLTVIVDSLEKTREAISLNGGTIHEEPVTLREGMRLSFASDPEGNLIELAENRLCASVNIKWVVNSGISFTRPHSLF